MMLSGVHQILGTPDWRIELAAERSVGVADEYAAAAVGATRLV
jgi:hypothetical protein